MVGFTNIHLRKEVNGMRNEKDIKFIFSDEFDVESYNRILDLIKQLIISIQDEDEQKIGKRNLIGGKFLLQR